MTLSRSERVLKRKVNRDSQGRYCLVLERHPDGTYIICYLTTFSQANHGKNIQSKLARLFSVAIDDTPDFPPGTPSVKVVPKWRGTGFLFAVPVRRQNLMPHKLINVRFILRMGELERVKRLILERVKIFREYEAHFRADEIRWKHFYSWSDRYKAEIVDDADGEPTLVTGDIDSAAIPVEAPSDVKVPIADEPSLTVLPRMTSKVVSSRPDMLAGQSRRPPRIHYLETNYNWFNLRWSLMGLHSDVMNSSYYLNAIGIGRRIYKRTASILPRLPIRGL